MIELDKYSYSETVALDGITLVDFWATWCGPCKVMTPILEKLEEELEDVTFTKVDVDAQQDVAREVGIQAMPTFVLYKDGVEVDRKVGACSKADIVVWIDEYI